MADAFESTRDELIERYFQRGYAYKEIQGCLLANHDIKISYRQLKRQLKKLNLSRRKRNIPASTVINAIESELSGSGSLLGYRALHRVLITKHQINVSRKLVCDVQKLIDPDATELRKKRRLKRRKYLCRGPNDRWHFDGYDKLKRFGFCIHGCIDGYSRKILWLQVGDTNNNPEVVASYFTDYVKSIAGTARKIRCDFGTENLNINAIQVFFRTTQTDQFSGENSYQAGSSHSNQRIEAWWSIYRKWNSNWWMNYFKDMEDMGEFNDSDAIQKECLRFCFMQILQRELDEIRELHNNHRIRPYANQTCPSGRPELIYNIPEAYGTFDYKVGVSQSDIEVAEEGCCKAKSTYGCSKEFEELALSLLFENHLEMPTTCNEAKVLYMRVINLIDDL